MSYGSQFRNRSIRFKLSALAAFNSGFAIVLVGLFLLVYERVELHQAAAQGLFAQAGVVADGSTAALSFADEQAASETLTALRSDPTLVEAAIYDAKDHLFAWYERTPSGGVPDRPPERAVPAGESFENGNLLVSRAIVLRGQRIGTVYLKESLTELDSRRRRYMGVLGLVLVAAFGIALFLSTKMQRSITRPLAELSSLARLISTQKDYSVRAKRHAGDEVGVLVDSFNEMLAQIGSGEEALRESEERFALAARGANDGLWDWKRSTGLLYLSPRGNQMFGYPEVERYWSVSDFAEQVHRSDRERVIADWKKGVRDGREEFVSEYRMRHASKSSIWVLSRGKAVKDTAGTVVRIAGSLTDITEGKIADALTGLHSRFYFLDRLESALDALANGGSRFAILFLDLDRFKIVNDSLGHAAGDELLVEIARRLRLGVQGAGRETKQSVVARFGGDEFAVLLNGAGPAEAAEIAQRILCDLSTPFRLGSRQMFPGVSIGIAPSGSGYTPEDLLRNADTAMYHAKQSGRGRVEVFDEQMRNHALARMEIETDLRAAVEQNQLVVFFQSQVEVVSGRMHGFEALVRWRHPKRGLIPPGEFISIAEETDLIIPLGRVVLTEACRQMAAWQKQFQLDPPLTVSVNVSYKQMKDPGFVQDVRRILEATELAPHSLRLEMTESTVMTDAEETIETLRQLKAMDIGLEIDDFGTGYSSLSCLKRLPFDTVKIDRSFVRELGGNEEAAEIVRAILDLASSMTLEVVAEGVETNAQLKALKSLGCSLAQGFLFSKPVAAGAAQLLVEDEAFRRGLASLEAQMQGRDYREISADADQEICKK
jgi:diguanylate cyclase (GGDEF)-like protein/PAS domain S-box-containing protein